MTLHEKIKLMCDRKGWGLVDLARTMGVPASRLSEIANQPRGPSVYKVQAIAHALDCSIDTCGANE